MATNLAQEVVFLDPLPEPQPEAPSLSQTTELDIVEEEWVELEGRITLLAACKDGSLPVEKIASKVVNDLRKLRKGAVDRAATEIQRIQLEARLAAERGIDGSPLSPDQVSDLERTCNDLQTEAAFERDEADNLAAELCLCREELRQYQDERPETTGTLREPEFNKAHYSSLSEELATSQMSMQELQKRYDGLQAECASLEGELSAWRDRAAAGASATSHAQEVLRKEVSEYQQAAVSSGAEVMLLRSELQQARASETGRADLLAELASAKAMATSASESRQALRGELTEARAVASAASESRSALRAELLEERTAAFTTSQTSQSLFTELAEAQQVAAAARASRTQMQTELLEERAKRIGTGTDDMLPTFSSLPGSEDLILVRNQLESEIRSAENKARSAENKVADLRSQVDLNRSELRQREDELRKSKISVERLGEELLETSRELRQLKLNPRESPALRLDSPPENHKAPADPGPFASTLNYDEQPASQWLPSRDAISGSGQFGGLLDRRVSDDRHPETPSTLEGSTDRRPADNDAQSFLENRILTLTNRVRQMDNKVRQQQQELENLQTAAPSQEPDCAASDVPGPLLNSISRMPTYAASDTGYAGPVVKTQVRTPVVQDVSLVPGGLNTNLDHSWASSVNVLNRTDTIMHGARLAMERVGSLRSNMRPQIQTVGGRQSPPPASPGPAMLMNPAPQSLSGPLQRNRAASPPPARTTTRAMSPISVVRSPVVAVPGQINVQGHTVVMSPVNSPRSISITVPGNGTVPAFAFMGDRNTP